MEARKVKIICDGNPMNFQLLDDTGRNLAEILHITRFKYEIEEVTKVPKITLELCAVDVEVALAGELTGGVLNHIEIKAENDG